ncbi:hypothetical protein FMO001_27900 [Moritella sp. F1]|nr:hypothetical protein FMO001_27900 [Moritella sp. F1]
MLSLNCDSKQILLAEFSEKSIIAAIETGLNETKKFALLINILIIDCRGMEQFGSSSGS